MAKAVQLTSSQPMNRVSMSPELASRIMVRTLAASRMCCIFMRFCARPHSPAAYQLAKKAEPAVIMVKNQPRPSMRQLRVWPNMVKLRAEGMTPPEAMRAPADMTARIMAP